MANLPPTKYLLYRLAERLFGNNTAALAEPISATFARGLVDTQNNLVLTAAQAAALVAGSGGVINGGVTFPRGTLALGDAVDHGTVAGLALSDVPSQILVTVRKATGGLNLFASVRGDSMTADGFSFDLSAATDSADYKLDYLILM